MKTIEEFMKSIIHTCADCIPETPLEDLLDECDFHYAVGSRETCSPPPTDTDRDILCVVNDTQDFVDLCIEAGFRSASKQYRNQRRPENSSPFNSLSRGDVNLIVTDDVDFARLFMIATSIAKRRNIMDKQDRVALFQKILYGNES